MSERLAGLERQIQHRLEGRLRHFRLIVRDQGLVLQGQAQTYYVKQLTQHVVIELTGLRILANEIEVRDVAYFE
jgi:hypothetical protein